MPRKTRTNSRSLSPQCDAGDAGDAGNSGNSGNSDHTGHTVASAPPAHSLAHSRYARTCSAASPALAAELAEACRTGWDRAAMAAFLASQTGSPESALRQLRLRVLLTIMERDLAGTAELQDRKSTRLNSSHT